MHYRLYRLSPSTGSIVSGSDIEAAGDEEAIRHARAELGKSGIPFELWQRTRCVVAHRRGAAAAD